MKYKSIYILIFFQSIIYTQDLIGGGLCMEELINYINEHYKTPSVLSYSNARDILYSEIDNNNGYVYCVYTNYSVELDQNVDPSTHLYDNGMNCEHLWPQSLGAENSPMKSDMHHLRACKENVNTSRGNKPYADIPPLLRSK